MANVQTFTLLNAATSVSTGTPVGYPDAKNWNFYIVSSSVTSGATLKIRGSHDGTSWVDISSTTVTTNTGMPIQITNQHWPQLVGVITARTDGTYTVYATGGD